MGAEDLFQLSDVPTAAAHVSESEQGPPCRSPRVEDEASDRAQVGSEVVEEVVDKHREGERTPTPEERLGPAEL